MIVQTVRRVVILDLKLSTYLESFIDCGKLFKAIGPTTANNLSSNVDVSSEQPSRRGNQIAIQFDFEWLPYDAKFSNVRWGQPKWQLIHQKAAFGDSEVCAARVICRSEDRKHDRDDCVRISVSLQRSEVIASYPAGTWEFQTKCNCSSPHERRWNGLRAELLTVLIVNDDLVLIRRSW